MYYIVTDSSTDMPQSWVEAQHDFHIVSLSCTINGVSSVPGTSEVAKKETYRQLRSGANLHELDVDPFREDRGRVHPWR